MQEQTGQREIPEQENSVKQEEKQKLEVVPFEKESGLRGLIDPLLRQGKGSPKPLSRTY